MEVLQEIPHRYTAIRRLDAVHLATMERHRIARIMTFDSGFDGYPGVVRVTP